MCLYLGERKRNTKEYYGHLGEQLNLFFPINLLKMKKITLVEKDEILTNDSSAAKVLNNSFSNIVKTLGISDYMHSHPLAKEVNYPTLRVIMKSFKSI